MNRKGYVFVSDISEGKKRGGGCVMKSTQLSALRSNVLSSLPLYQAISLSRFLIPFFICSFLSAHPIPFHRAVCNLLKSHYKCDDRLILGLSLLLPLYGSLLLPYCARAPQE